MTQYPTDLTPAETRRAHDRLATLADELTASGDLQTAPWRETFLNTWRHPYVPAYYPSMTQPPVLCIDDEHRDSWLDAVYSNQTLITKVAPLPLSRAFAPATGWMYTSSSTLPSLLLRMLEALDIHDGHRVLEIGTGSGYNAALLCQRLGSDHVTSIDIDPELVDLARERLAANGHTPTLAAVDGADGAPDGGPYDRIIATCSVTSIPQSWLDQAARGAVILTAISGPLGGALARLTVDDHSTATGRFLPDWGGFMGMRSTAEPTPATPGQRWEGENPTCSLTDVDPNPLLRDGEILGFLAQWQLPGVTRGIGTSDNGRPALSLWADDGSRATVETTPAGAGYRVSTTGPRHLWDTIEHIHNFWRNHQRPGYDRFGVTATPDQQFVWLDEPGQGPRWALA